MRKTEFKISGNLKSCLVLGIAGGLISIVIIKLNHNGSHLMYLPAFICLIISVYTTKIKKEENKYFVLFYNACITAIITILVFYLYLEVIYFLSPLLSILYLWRLCEILFLGILCCALLSLNVRRT